MKIFYRVDVQRHFPKLDCSPASLPSSTTPTDFNQGHYALFDITCGCSRPIDNLGARKCWRGWKSEFIHKFIEKPAAYRGREWKQVMGINSERNLMKAAVPTAQSVGAPDVVVAVLPSALNTNRPGDDDRAELPCTAGNFSAKSGPNLQLSTAIIYYKLDAQICS